MLWEVRRLPAPSSRKGTRHSDAPCLTEWLPGEKEYGLNPEAVAYFADKPHILSIGALPCTLHPLLLVGGSCIDTLR